MSVPLLDLQRQYLSMKQEIDDAVMRVVAAQRFILGGEVEALEAAIGGYVGSKHAIGCASGTDALLLSLKALPLQPGDEVVVPSFTFFATAGAVWNAGFKPVFADIDPVSFNMTAANIEAALTPATRAVIVVHLYGQMAPMAPIMELAARHNLFVIEDAAQSIGAPLTTEALRETLPTFRETPDFAVGRNDVVLFAGATWIEGDASREGNNESGPDRQDRACRGPVLL